VAAVQRYPELGAPEVSQSEVLRRWNAWEAVTLTNRSRARRAWRAQRQAKRHQVGSMDQGFEDSDDATELSGRDVRE
jgi:hypothetical protein